MRKCLLGVTRQGMKKISSYHRLVGIIATGCPTKKSISYHVAFSDVYC